VWHTIGVIGLEVTAATVLELWETAEKVRWATPPNNSEAF
jgi:hypothetical protein